MPPTEDDIPKPKWFYSPWFVLCFIFVLGAGPFGLPLLWKSPRFGRTAKIIWTVATAIFTLLLIQATVTIVRVALDEIRKLQSVM